jgi:hypothetical protein
MRTSFRAAAAAAALLSAGCFSPTAPSETIIHTAPARLVLIETMQYRCTTQPRIYCRADGTCFPPEIDTYASDTPCPPIPIE